ncbi:hypothetical protein L1987_43413 [Smallanthus sonchifolius]|uniref:Uncharacterized protein n=1 Tax=Smallanthus sonchifolius TaxID=185202 RepID=A0ACB9GMI9_9ASTR|nr:hypothetical protein L1987_43413 [Smallanthus sonchifolius]
MRCSPGVVSTIKAKLTSEPKNGWVILCGWGEPLRFGPREFCLITGLRFGKWDGEIPSLDSKFQDRVFGGRRTKIEQLEQLYNGDTSHIQDDDIANFRPVGINPNDLEGISMCDPHFEEVKQTKTTEDSEKLDKILNMMEEIVTLKRKWSIVEDDPTRPLSDHEEEEAKEYRNENVDDFNMNFADTPRPPSVEIVDRPKRIKKPSSNV